MHSDEEESKRGVVSTAAFLFFLSPPSLSLPLRTSEECFPYLALSHSPEPSIHVCFRRCASETDRKRLGDVSRAKSNDDVKLSQAKKGETNQQPLAQTPPSLSHALPFLSLNRSVSASLLSAWRASRGGGQPTVSSGNREREQSISRKAATALLLDSRRRGSLPFLRLRVAPCLFWASDSSNSWPRGTECDVLYTLEG